MAKKEFFEFSEQEEPILADSRERDSLLNMFDSGNPDISLFNMVDGEITNLAGSPILIYRHIPGGVDNLYDENDKYNDIDMATFMRRQQNRFGL